MRALALSLALAASGCGAWVYTPTIVLGGFEPEPSEQMFQRLRMQSRERGYEPREADVRRGRFVVAARHHMSEADPETLFVVQCFRGGWVQVGLRGPWVTDRGDEHRVPSTLRDEFEEYAVALRGARAEGE